MPATSRLETADEFWSRYHRLRENSWLLLSDALIAPCMTDRFKVSLMFAKRDWRRAGKRVLRSYAIVRSEIENTVT
jgi:hypothetical protein